MIKASSEVKLMENFLISFNVVFPIFLLMALGFLLRQIKLLSEPTVKQMNQFVFKAVLPASIFKNVYDSSVKEVFDGRLLAFSLIATLCVILLALFASPAAVSSFTMAEQMGGDGELAGQLMMFGTTLSVVTMFGFIYAAVSLGIL